MLNTADLATWLTQRGITDAIVPGPYMPSTPDRLVVLVPTGGPGLMAEGNYDTHTVQVWVRGSKTTPQLASDFTDDAALLAQQVDLALLGASVPTYIGPTRCLHIDRVGGSPAYHERDHARRIVYVCNYLVTLASGLLTP